jgi:hypothetical protein
VSSARASGRWVFRRLDVRTRARYGAGDVVRGSAGIQAQFCLALFKLDFLQKFKQECSEL